MPKGKRVVKRIREESEKRPQRIVIDEVLSDKLYRITFAELESADLKPDLTSEAAWGVEDMDYVNREELESLLSEPQMDEIREGQVFFVERKKAKNVHEEIRKHMKEETKKILDWEGKSRPESKGEQ